LPGTGADGVASVEYSQPDELGHHLVFLTMIDGNYADEYGSTTAWDALERFLARTPSDEGKELLRQCIRNLHAALEHLQGGDVAGGQKLAAEVEQTFKACQKHITIGDA
jgi:hypothetical protein